MKEDRGRIDEAAAVQEVPYQYGDDAIPNDRSRIDASTEMTRGQQTAWIVGTLIAIALAFAYWATRLPESDPFAKCQRIIGYDSACRAKVAASQMMKGFY